MKKYLLLIGLLPIYLGIGEDTGIVHPIDGKDGNTPVADTIRLVKLDEGFRRARSIYATNQPRLYIVESGRHRFLILNGQGSRLDSVGNQGFGNYQFDRPLDIDATNGLKIYVTDYHNGRIQLFDRRLQFLSSLTPPIGNDRFFSYQPTVLTVSDNQEIFFYEEDSGYIIHYNENGEYTGTIRVRTDRRLQPPVDLATYNERLLLADSARGVLHFLHSGGQYIKYVGGLDKIRGLSTSPEGLWALTKDRLVHLNGRGRFIRTFTWSKSIHAVDVAVAGRKVYLLTSRSVWQGIVPRNE